jgi:carboxyl-terminal processing protease
VKDLIIDLKNTKETRKKVSLSLGIIVILFVGYLIGFNVGESRTEKRIPDDIANALENKPEDVDFSTFWKAWNIINEIYVDNDKVLPQDKVWGAIAGLAGSTGDPYTTFFPPKEAEMFEENIRGNFGGVGMEVGMKEDILTVIAPLKDTPAQRAGILAGDNILAIDQKSTAGMTVDEAVGLIRGEVGTKVKLTLVRKGREGTFDIEITRDTIKIPTSETELRSDGIFVIKLFNFSAISPNEFREALRNFLEQGGNDKLILDLRGNPGGFLNAAVDIASWFLPAGKVIVTEDYGKNGEDIVHRSKGYDIFNDNLKFVILVNEGSASASEILAGALKEHGKAIIVGTDTFGKGSVQELVEITDNTSLKVTVAKWLTPDGNSISDGGVKPDYKVEFTQDDFKKGIDPQLNKAVEILLKK